MAFWLFLSLLPLAAVAGLIAAKLALDSATFSAWLFETLPVATRTLVATELGNMAAWKGGQFGVVAAMMFIWLASSGIASIFDGVEIETGSKPRSWVRKRLYAIGVCVALSAGIAVLALLSVGFGWIARLAGDPAWVSDNVFFSAAGTVLRAVIGLAVAIAMVTGLYWVAVPRPIRATIPLVPGAAFAVVLQLAVGQIYGLYLRTVGDGGAYQAGLASIGVTMIALYLLCVSLLVGVELNQMIAERRGIKAGSKWFSFLRNPRPAHAASGGA